MRKDNSYFGERLCSWCNEPLDDSTRLNQRYHPQCQIEHRHEVQRDYQNRKRSGTVIPIAVQRGKHHCSLMNVGMDYVSLRLRRASNEQ